MSSISMTRGWTAMRATRARRGPGEQMLTPRDLELLGWLGEQYAGRQDHLERLLGCGDRQARRVIARLQAHGLVRVERVLVKEPAWITPTARGLTLADSGFRVWKPNLTLLGHTAAVNNVRLHIQARSPQATWTCERELSRNRLSGHLPDAIVTLDGEDIAIEVELTLKSSRRLQAILNELAGRYDTILYFAAPRPHKALTELAKTGRWPSLGIRELPTIVGEPV